MPPSPASTGTLPTAWTDLISYGDAIPAGGTVNGFGAFHFSRTGAVAAQLYAGGVRYLVVRSNGVRTVADNARDG